VQSCHCVECSGQPPWIANLHTGLIQVVNVTLWLLCAGIWYRGVHWPEAGRTPERYALYILYWILMSYSLTTRVLSFSVACACRCCRSAVVPEYHIFCMQPVRGRGTNSGGSEIFRTRPDRRWGPPNLLCNGYRVSFSGVERPGLGGNTHLHLMPRLKKE
jgi:hypothetical protein